MKNECLIQCLLWQTEKNKPFNTPLSMWLKQDISQDNNLTNLTDECFDMSVQVKWFRGSKEGALKEITKSDKYEMMSDKLHRTLRIKNCVDSDADTYWCMLGDMKCSAHLEVARKSTLCVKV